MADLSFMEDTVAFPEKEEDEEEEEEGVEWGYEEGNPLRVWVSGTGRRVSVPRSAWLCALRLLRASTLSHWGTAVFQG